MHLVTAGEMRAFDATAINDYGIPGIVLMENAGRTTFQILREYIDSDIRGLKVAVLAGPGNNGGDGYVIARYLINHGAEVRAYLLAEREKITGDALTNLEVLERMNAWISPLREEAERRRNYFFLYQSHVIIDAILGTGLNSDVRSPYADVIRDINVLPALRIAVDIPSGLHADTGKVLGEAVRANVTATYGFCKLGMALHPGTDYCGKIHVVDISIPLPALESTPPRSVLYQRPDAWQYVRVRKDPLAHKGTFGHVLVVGGSPGKTGAVAMAARAAARIGAGLVTAAVPESLNQVLETKCTEEMTEPLPEGIPGHLGEASIPRLLELTEDKQCVVIGPGLSTTDGVQALVTRLISEYPGWVLLDADGLNVLAGKLSAFKHAKSKIVVTPHPGEMGRLAGISAKTVQENRLDVSRSMAEDYGVWVVLKGSRTLTVSHQGRLYINTSGSAWMASGGQGDVLSGILGGLLAQNLTGEEALPFGVYVHGLAADNLLAKTGGAPVLATDVLDELPRTIGGLLEPERRANREDSVTDLLEHS